MHKKTIGIILTITVIFIVAIIIWGTRQTKELQANVIKSSSDSNNQADIIYYYGQDVHSKNVDKFISDNNIENKISFAKKEAWFDQKNNAEMLDRAKECALDESNIGVPFLYARGKCYVGEIEVQNFLKRESGIQ